jgi:hypothetical protein
MIPIPRILGALRLAMISRGDAENAENCGGPVSSSPRLSLLLRDSA